MSEEQQDYKPTPFYEDAHTYREAVRRGQIVKGLSKYGRPFNSSDWTAEELLAHAMQENVDQAHYIYGLYELLKAAEARNP